MNWKAIMWVAAVGLLLAGCGGRDTPPMGEGEYQKYFGRDSKVASDHSVKIAAFPTAASYATSDEIVLKLTVSNMAKKALTLPIGRETDDTMVYTYFQALVCRDDGPIKHVDITATEGDLVKLALQSYETVTRDFVVSDYYQFDTPGTYQIVLFYSVKDEPLPGGGTPDWTGTVWTSPITVVVE
jgi:hypothetical protein